MSGTEPRPNQPTKTFWVSFRAGMEKSAGEGGGQTSWGPVRPRGGVAWRLATGRDGRNGLVPVKNILGGSRVDPGRKQPHAARNRPGEGSHGMCRVPDGWMDGAGPSWPARSLIGRPDRSLPSRLRHAQRRGGRPGASGCVRGWCTHEAEFHLHSFRFVCIGYLASAAAPVIIPSVPSAS